MLNIVATCWNVVATCWILIQLPTFWREVEMADEEMLLSLCASSVVTVIMKRRQKRRKNRKIWTREWLRNRTIFGAYYTLLAELRNLDISSYRNFLRTGTEKSRTDWSVDWCYQNSIRTRTQLIPTLRPPCWYCHETTWHQTRKTIGLSRSTAGNLLNGIEPSSIFVQQRSTTFNMLNGRFQRSTSHDTLSTFVEQRLQHLLLNKCWTVYHWLKNLNAQYNTKRLQVKTTNQMPA